ncbi:acyltransferase family protein [Mucilaginibacter sp. UC70_90]
MATMVINQQEALKNTGTTKASRPRLLSLDFFRGFTVAAMILVNDPGDWGHIYWPLEHSKWNGCTPTDLVFPFFLFMVGVSIVYAMESKKADIANHNKLLLSILRRTLIIIALGVCLPLINDFQFAHLRFPGVLQRIGLVFGITALLYVKTGIRTQVIIAVSCLIGYYLLMTLAPVPGFGTPNLEPATNLGAWIDRSVFTENHLWSSSKTWDPEGLLGTIPSVATCLLGVFTGTWLKMGKLATRADLLKIMGAGIVLIILALIWNPFFPINKQLWTSSFVLLTAGLAINILALSYWFIDIKGNKALLPPFLAFGRNAIAAYVLADIIPALIAAIPVGKTNLWSFTYNHLFVPYLSPENASLAGAILTVLIIFIPVWILYKRNITIKV